MRRLEAGQFPVDVLGTFSNGERRGEVGRVAGAGACLRSIARSRRLAQIEPERLLLLDQVQNNSRNSRADVDKRRAVELRGGGRKTGHDLFGPRMRTIDAFVEGVNRVKRGPVVSPDVAATLLLAMPWRLRCTNSSRRIWREHGRKGSFRATTPGGTSLAQKSRWRELRAGILGFAAVMKNQRRRGYARACRRGCHRGRDQHAHFAVQVGAACRRLARDREFGAGAFFATCAVSVRFIRLA